MKKYSYKITTRVGCCFGLLLGLGLAVNSRAATATQEDVGQDTFPSRQKRQQLVTIVSPLAGAKVKESTIVSLKFAPLAELDTLSVKLNGSDITKLFRNGDDEWEGWYERERVRKSSVNYSDGLQNGSNLLIVEVEGKDRQSLNQHIYFDAKDALGAAAALSYAPAVSLDMPAIDQDGIARVVRIGQQTLPVSSFCSTAMEVLVLDRSSLAQTDYQCFDDASSMRTYLKARTSSDLVIADTTGTANAPASLDTTPIGGTDYSNSSQYPLAAYPQQYAIIGSGGASAGQATENYSVPNTPNAPFQYARWFTGMLSKDQNNHYNYHPSDIREFKAYPNDPAYGTSSFTVGQTYTAPAGQNGFWLLVLDRMLLQPIDSGSGACKYGVGSNIGTCGTFYPTGEADTTAAATAQTALAAALTSQSPRNLIVLLSVGAPFANNTIPAATHPPEAALANALTSLGASDLLLRQCAASPFCSVPSVTPTYTLISSTDTTFATLLTGKGVFSSNLYTAQGQTGFVRGLVSRGLNSLFYPSAYSQESPQQVAQGKGRNFEFQQVAWAPPVQWPLTDTPGHIAAYKALSFKLVTTYIQGASGDHLNDIRYYYYGSSNLTIANGTPYANTFPYPGDGNGYTAQDWQDATSQLSTELAYLRQTLNYFGADWVGGMIAGNSTSVALSLAQAAATVQSSILKPAATAKVGLNASSMINLAGALTGFVPDLSLLGAIISTASAAGGSFTTDPDAIASTEYTIYTSIATAAANANTYVQNIQSGYNISVDNIYSDWYKLSTVALNISNTNSPWYISDKAVTSGLAAAVSLGAQGSIYLQMLPQTYKKDAWLNQPQSDPKKIGSWKLQTCDRYGNCTFSCTSFYAAQNVPSQFVYALPLQVTNGPQYDLYVLSQGVTNNGSSFVSENYPADTVLPLLTGTDPGQLNLPLDYLYVASSPIQNQAGPVYSNGNGFGVCYNLGGKKVISPN